jgi:hypothetical protein
MSYDDARVLKLLAKYEDNRRSLIEELLGNVSAQRLVIEYLLEEGIIRIQHRNRKVTRVRIMAEELSETGIRPVGPSIPRYDLSTVTKKKIRDRTTNMLMTWKIGDIPLGDMTKAGLLKQAKHEMASGKGHYGRARWYEGLAKPLEDDTKTVKEYWRNEGVRLLRQSILDEIANQPDPLPPSDQRPDPPPPPG